MSDAKPSRQEQAAAWFAAQRAGAMLLDQREEFDAWRADPRNQAALDAMHELWGELAVLKFSRPAQARPAPARGRFLAAGIAIAIFAAAGVGWATFSADRTIRTVAGQQKSQPLPDGSLIAVNVASAVSYDVNSSARVVKIAEGEAAFSVKPDVSKPFVVQAGDFEVRAVGTSFNVRRRDGLVEVAVSEGVVQICALSGPQAGVPITTLGAGQLLRFPASISAGAFPTNPTSVPADQISEWRKRVVTYEDATVREVVDDLNRYFEEKLLIGEDELAAKRVTIRLQVENRDLAVTTLAALLDVSVVETSTGEVLKSKT